MVTIEKLQMVFLFFPRLYVLNKISRVLLYQDGFKNKYSTNMTDTFALTT